MAQAIGRRSWAIADGHIPAWSHGPEPQMTSHEALCVLNTSDSEAHVSITVFFTDREPIGPYRVSIPAQRTRHIRYNDLDDPQRIPPGVDYSALVQSDIPVVVQHTRLDSRQSENALVSVMGFAE